VATTTSALRQCTDLNTNARFKPNSFNKVEVPWIPRGGTFDFELERFVDRQSSRLGVRERHFNTRLRQTGNFIHQENIVRALQEGLRGAVVQVLLTTSNLHDRDRFYFTLSSNRLTNNFQGWGLRAGEW